MLAVVELLSSAKAQAPKPEITHLALTVDFYSKAAVKKYEMRKSTMFKKSL